MHLQTLVLSALALLPTALISAQAPPQNLVRQVGDGGVRGVLVSIFVPPLPNAPFSLVLATDWTRPLGATGTYTLVNHRRILRDTAGRIYQERWMLVPKGSRAESVMNRFEISNPAAHTFYNCEVAEKICFLERYRATSTTTYKPATQPSGPLPESAGYHLHEDLGTDTLQGVLTTGYRETTTINPGVLGNDQPMVTTREFWYSPELGLNLLSRHDDPQSGKQTFTVSELVRSDPDPSFFQVPPTYKVVDQRSNESLQ